MSEMDACDEAERAKSAVWESLASAYEKNSDMLRCARDAISMGYEELRRERGLLVEENGGGDVSDGDIIEINAGGKIVAATRGTLTRVKGTGLEVLFSGRWENKILRDEMGRVFLDVNPKSFRSIVDWLHEFDISSPDATVSPPSVDEDNTVFLVLLEALFGFHASAHGFVLVGSSTGAPPASKTLPAKEEWQDATFSEFPIDLRKGFEKERAQLERSKLTLEKERQMFQKEKDFMKAFLKNDDEDESEIVHLNVSGARMSAKRSTLCLYEASVLAKQFSDPTKWHDSGGKGDASVEDWTCNQVREWAEKLPRLPADVPVALMAESITGAELLAMGRQDFKELGITRTGTLALLMSGLNELRLRKLQQREVLVEHSPYAFGKILDVLRLQVLCRDVGNDLSPSPLPIRAEEEARFKKVVEYYFPGFVPGVGTLSSSILSRCKFLSEECARVPSAGGFSFGAPAVAAPRRPFGGTSSAPAFGKRSSAAPREPDPSVPRESFAVPSSNLF